jgi:hypothetical protein
VTPTSSLVDVTDAIVTLLKGPTAASLGLKDVWYGDDDLIPNTPAINVTGNNKNTELAGTGHLVYTNHTVYLTVFHSRLDAPQVTRRESDLLAEEVEALLHSDPTLGGLIIFGYVSALETGVASRGQVIMRSSRLTWTGQTRTRL